MLVCATKCLQSQGRLRLSRRKGNEGRFLATGDRTKRQRPNTQRFRPAATLTESQDFQECTDKMVRLGLSEEEGILALKDAFGWSKQTYWRKSKVEEMPTLRMVEERIEKLTEIGMTDTEVGKVISAFPEFLGCPASLLERNIEYVQTTFFVKNKQLVQTLLRKPAVLGNVVDCQGDCVGDCNRCWVRF